LNPTQAPRLSQVIDAFHRHDRRRISALITEELSVGDATSAEHWRSVEGVANQIGEIELGLEAARRNARTSPPSLERALHFCNLLAARGRIDECLREAAALTPVDQEHPEVLHLRGSIAMRMGEFVQAADLARRTIALAPQTGKYWLALAMARKFSTGDQDLARMEAVASQIRMAPAGSQAAFFYALGKARHDCGDYDRAFAAYSEGATRRRTRFDASATERFVRDVLNDFTPENLRRLTPSACDSNRAIFVTGLPRSGTTLVEQILASHSAVEDGEEANLFCSALMPAGDFSLRGGLDYQGRSSGGDPWGDVGRDYLAMLKQRFGDRGRIVDKTLNHSRFLGFILHALPNAKVIWMRRNPEDTAISCFRSYFATGTIPWSCSLEDIGWQFALEDALHAHWTRVYPERILTVPYEALATDPTPWITRILAHVGLEKEDAPFTPHLTKRAVQTASVAQVREPISATSVGAAENYRAHLQPFRDAAARFLASSGTSCLPL
jgi:tetratricopeptide (TPR) repeat protein